MTLLFSVPIQRAKMGKGYIKRLILNFRTYTNSQCFGKNKNIEELQEAPVPINVET